MPWHLVVSWGSLLVSCGYAAWRGGGPERTAAAMLLTAVVATHLVHPPMSSRYLSVDIGALIVDLILWIAFLGLALTADRYWPMWIAATQSLGTAAHLLGIPQQEFLQVTYSILTQVEIYPMLIILIGGTANHRSRIQQFGSDGDWSTF